MHTYVVIGGVPFERGGKDGDGIAQRGDGPLPVSGKLQRGRRGHLELGHFHPGQLISGIGRDDGAQQRERPVEVRDGGDLLVPLMFEPAGLGVVPADIKLHLGRAGRTGEPLEIDAQRFAVMPQRGRHVVQRMQHLGQRAVGPRQHPGGPVVRRFGGVVFQRQGEQAFESGARPWPVVLSVQSVSLGPERAQAQRAVVRVAGGKSVQPGAGFGAQFAPLARFTPLLANAGLLIVGFHQRLGRRLIAGRAL